MVAIYRGNHGSLETVYNTEYSIPGRIDAEFFSSMKTMGREKKERDQLTSSCSAVLVPLGSDSFLVFLCGRKESNPEHSMRDYLWVFLGTLGAGSWAVPNI
jgi:hypothetical protein